MDVKYVLFNITLEEIKLKTKFDKFINQTKKELMNQKVKAIYFQRATCNKKNKKKKEEEHLRRTSRYQVRVDTKYVLIPSIKRMNIWQFSL